MKTGFIILVVSLCPLFLTAQEAVATKPAPMADPGLPAELSTALGKGDAQAIARFLGDKVELTIRGEEATLMKSEAQTRLQEFYAQNPPKGFKPMHSGNSKTQESNYNIGELMTDKGTYRVYLYFTQAGADKVVSELRFEQ